MKLAELKIGENKIAPHMRFDWDAEGIDFYEDVEYGRGGDHGIYLDMMIPRDGKKSRPVLIWIHGGGWMGGEKKYRPTHALVRACHDGFVVASIDYRLCTEAPFPAPIEDCKCAVRFFKAHAEELGIDPERIGVWGESAGGQLAALVGASYMNPDLEGVGGYSEYSSRVAAVCDWYCGGDMTHMGAYKEPEVQKRAEELGITLTRMPAGAAPGGDGDDEEHGFAAALFGGSARRNYKLGMAISPIFYVEEELPPYLLMHGDADAYVTPQFSYNFNDALLSHGHDSTFVLIPRQGHGFFRGEGYYDIVLNFFKKYLLK